MSLYIKYRPLTFDEIQGNTETVNALKIMLQDIKSCPHTFLLQGDTGCGKTTLGRIIGKELGCVGADFKEIDSADFRGIDTIRTIRKQAQYKPLEGNCTVYLIDECHKLTGDAQNALLKILEDTPEHIYFILATTDPQKLIKTIKSRCSIFQVNPLQERQLMKLLHKIVKKEEKTIDKRIYEQIIDTSLGRPREAIQLLEQILYLPENEQLKMAQKKDAELAEGIELSRALLRNAGWKEIRTILTGLQQQEPETIRRQILGYCKSVLLKSDNEIAGKILYEMLEPFYNTGFPGLVSACYIITKR